MSLSGSLADFEISDIFHIIAQENKTGKLILFTDEIEGQVIFKQGKIISAGTNRQNVKKMLLKYLYHIVKIPDVEINEINYFSKENLQLLIKEIQQKNYMTQKELTTIIETGVEDIVCSLFFIKRGTFRFDPSPNVNAFQFSDFALQTDAITMEAARRVDEWDNITHTITRNSVFILSETATPVTEENISAIGNFPGYLTTRIDGSSTTEFLCQDSFFSEYQVYTALFELFSSNVIAPLPENISHSVKAALKRNDKSKTFQNINTISSTIVIVASIIIVVMFGRLILHGKILAPLVQKQHHAKNIILNEQSASKIAMATLYYHANFGSSPSHVTHLIKNGILEKRDLSQIPTSSNIK